VSLLSLLALLHIPPDASPLDILASPTFTSVRKPNTKLWHRAQDNRSNEEQVGTAVQTSSVPRSDVFLTTKLGHADKISSRLVESVKKIDPSEGGYVDLFLIHAPSAGPEKRKEQWGELEKLVKDGQAKSIGVSN